MDEESADRRATGGQKGVGAELGIDASFPARLAKAKAKVAIKALDAEIEKGDEMRRKLIDDMEAVQGREDIMLQIEGGMAGGKKPVTDAEIDKALMNEVMKEPVSKGVEFITDTDEGQQVLDDYNDKPIVSKKNRPSESGRTQLQAAPSSEGLNQTSRVRQSRVSLTQSDSTAKLQKILILLQKISKIFQISLNISLEVLQRILMQNVMEARASMPPLRRTFLFMPKMVKR